MDRQREIDTFGKYIDHSRDDKFTFAGLQQLIDKYLVKNRSTGAIMKHHNSHICALPCAYLYKGRGQRKRMTVILRSKLIYSPIMAGVRTNIRQFASVLVDIDDNPMLSFLFMQLWANTRREELASDSTLEGCVQLTLPSEAVK